MLIRDNRWVIAVTVVLTVTHSSVLALANTRIADYASDGGWYIQILVLTVISFVVGLRWLLLRSRRVWSAVVLLLCYSVIAYANARYFDMDFIILTAMICEVGLLLTATAGRVMLGLVIATAMVTKWFAVYGLALPDLGGGVHLVLLVSYVVLLYTMFRFVREMQEQMRKQDVMQARLDGAVAQLTDANLGFQRHAVLAGEESASNERRRISREIHDTVGYTMTNIIMMMEEANARLESDLTRVRQLIRTTRLQAEQGWEEARSALRALRALRNVEISGASALTKLVRAFEQATGIAVNVSFGNVIWPMSEELEAVTYRFIQEGMTNSFRHGRATHIEIFLWDAKDELRLTMWDNGIGASEFKEGIGMNGLLERIAPLGGKLTARGLPQGFELAIVIPYTAQGAEV
ncbi:sensor histidine kinase [Salinispira pacifica]